jgi:hypothetical protein
MKRFAQLLQRLTLALMQLAILLLPSTRADWARAMCAELDRIGTGRDAFAWALGCVLAGLKERMDVMITAPPKISRWILAPEMLLCFIPLTIGWRDGIVGSSGIARLNVHVIQKYFLEVPGGTITLIAMLAGVFLASVGPLGLLAAFRSIVWGHPVRNDWARGFLITAPILYGMLTLLSRLAVGGLTSFGFGADDAFDFWSGILLLSALPALGAIHMLRIFPPSPQWSPVLSD